MGLGTRAPAGSRGRDPGQGVRGSCKLLTVERPQEAANLPP